MLNIGIIGYGSIGRDLVDYIREGKAGSVKVAAILVRDKNKVDTPLDSELFVDKAEDFFGKSLDIIIEGASHEAVKLYAERALSGGSDFMVASVGAFADSALYDRVLKAAEQAGRRLIIPSCAIGGLDRIAAGTLGPMEHITLISRKPPKAWYGTIVEEQVDIERITEPVCVFEGSARESARLFPQSVNVSAALSLAGVGFEQTKVKVYVDPGIDQNTHEINASGKFGEIRLNIFNTPSHNPKTGWIVAMSMAKVLKNLSTPLMIGL
ncbi:aspartate dehydrogenase [Ferviditalea candida]|uniref:L-aspartate dehydrogenase n=1 Tax=Ferviditalea candida TaxID=3108399 RepID=A0ABU5ZHD8_9BACL|nr:aspartate dehydrogenase [Paenibacillaceae bacterium T2]